MQTIGQGYGYLKANHFFVGNGIFQSQQPFITYFQNKSGVFLINAL